MSGKIRVVTGLGFLVDLEPPDQVQGAHAEVLEFVRHARAREALRQNQYLADARDSLEAAQNEPEHEPASEESNENVR